MQRQDLPRAQREDLLRSQREDFLRSLRVDLPRRWREHLLTRWRRNLLSRYRQDTGAPAELRNPDDPINVCARGMSAFRCTWIDILGIFFGYVFWIFIRSFKETLWSKA